MTGHSFAQRVDARAAQAVVLLCRGIRRAMVCGLLAFVVARASPALAQIYNDQTGQVIPGTQGITPGPGVDLSGWNTAGHQLEFAGLGSIDLTNASFGMSDITSASFYNSTLTSAIFTNANLTNASICGATLTNANFSGAIVKHL